MRSSNALSGQPIAHSLERLVMSCVERDYDPELPTTLLIAEVRELLGSQRRAERLICRYLADMADRIRDRKSWALAVYTDEYHAARSYFGLGERDTRERVRIGHALRSLPQVERAFSDGELSYSRVREVTRVATTLTEPIWLELARTLDMRTLERRVAGARAHSQTTAPASCPAPESTTEHDAGVSAMAQMPASSEAVAVSDRDGEPPNWTSVDRGGMAALVAEAACYEEPAKLRAEALSVEKPAELPAVATRIDKPAELRAEAAGAVLLAGIQSTSSSTLSVTLEMTIETWEMLERALSGVRLANSVVMSIDEALRAVAHAALAAQAIDGQAPHAPPGPTATDATIFDAAYRWADCQRSEALAPAAPCSCGERNAEQNAAQVEASESSLSPAALRAKPNAHCSERSATHLGWPAGRAPFEVEAPGRAGEWLGRLASHAQPAEYCSEQSATRVGLLRERAPFEVEAPRRTGEWLGRLASHAKSEGYCSEQSATHVGSSGERAPFEAKALSRDEWVGQVALRAQPGAHCNERSATQLGCEAPGSSSRRLGEEAAQPSRLAVSLLETEPVASRLLAVMRGRGAGWGVDELVESSGLLVQQVNAELTLLELAGKVRYRASGFELV